MGKSSIEPKAARAIRLPKAGRGQALTAFTIRLLHDLVDHALGRLDNPARLLSSLATLEALISDNNLAEDDGWHLDHDDEDEE